MKAYDAFSSWATVVTGGSPRVLPARSLAGPSRLEMGLLRQPLTDPDDLVTDRAADRWPGLGFRPCQALVRGGNDARPDPVVRQQQLQLAVVLHRSSHLLSPGHSSSSDSSRSTSSSSERPVHCMKAASRVGSWL